jgi:hypothetical protein
MPSTNGKAELTYPYWSMAVARDDGQELTLYWLETVEIGATVAGWPGRYTVHYMDGVDRDHWQQAEVITDNIEDAKVVAEAILRFNAVLKERA